MTTWPPTKYLATRHARHAGGIPPSPRNGSSGKSVSFSPARIAAPNSRTAAGCRFNLALQWRHDERGDERASAASDRRRGGGDGGDHREGRRPAGREEVGGATRERRRSSGWLAAACSPAARLLVVVGAPLCRSPARCSARPLLLRSTPSAAARSPTSSGHPTLRPSASGGGAAAAGRGRCRPRHPRARARPPLRSAGSALCPLRLPAPAARHSPLPRSLAVAPPLQPATRVVRRRHDGEEQDGVAVLDDVRERPDDGGRGDVPGGGPHGLRPLCRWPPPNRPTPASPPPPPRRLSPAVGPSPLPSRPGDLTTRRLAW